MTDIKDDKAQDFAAQVETPKNGVVLDEYIHLGPIAMFAISALIAISVVVIGLTIYHNRFGERQKIGVVDIPGVLKSSEMIFTDMISRAGSTDADRQQAYELVRTTGPKIEQALNDIQAECDCLLMAKAAVVGGSHVDYTPKVREVLGISEVNEQAVQERLRDALIGRGGANPNALGSSGLAPAAPTAPVAPATR